MLKLKLSRFGKKGYACYRIVVKERRSKRDGKCLEILGEYNPNLQPHTLKLNLKRLNYWQSQGAQPTETVRRLIKQHG